MKVFLKSPERIRLFRELAPNVPLPPEPILTRWCTWLHAAFYYSDHLDVVGKVLENLPDDESAALVHAREIIYQPNLHPHLAQIRAHFFTLSTSLERLESAGVPLATSLKELEHVRASLAIADTPAVKSARKKLDDVLARNPDLLRLQQLSTALDDEAFLPPDCPLSPAELSAYKFAPIVNCDIERAFSRYSSIFSDRRRSFTFENLAKHFMLSTNSSRAHDSDTQS